MELIYGTTNIAKLTAMRNALAPLGIKLIGLRELGINLPQIDESGKAPLDNARMKARAYWDILHLPVFSCDSGLYFAETPAALQPGVHVRNVGGKILSDNEMTAYYAALAERFGGKLTAQYLNAICLIMSDDEVFEHMGADISGEEFQLVSKPHERREEGFPLDPLSVHIKSGKYYNDLDSVVVDGGMAQGFANWFGKVLGRL